MSETVFDIVLALGWVVIQAAILYYYIPHLRVTRAAERELAAGDHADYAYRVAVDRVRAGRIGLAVVIGYMVIGFVVALQVHELRLLIGPVLFGGQLALLRDRRSDALLVRDLANANAEHVPVVADPEPAPDAAPEVSLD